MTLEERMIELETAIAALRRDMKPALKFNVGDSVLVEGRVSIVDQSDELPYKVAVGEDGTVMWLAESDLRAP